MDWDKWAEEQAAENRAASIRAEDALAKRKLQPGYESEHDKGVRLGWWDADGNPLATDDDYDDEEGEDE